MERAEVAQEAGLEEAGLEVEAKAEAEAKAAGWEPSRTCSRWQPPRHEERQRAVAHRRKHTPTTRHTRCRSPCMPRQPAACGALVSRAAEFFLGGRRPLAALARGSRDAVALGLVLLGFVGYQFGSPEGRAARRAAGGGGSDEVPAGEERRGDAEEEPLCAKLM